MSNPVTDKPTVLIVGAGLGGLMLGALLEKQGVPYTIFERASTVKPLGSGMAVGPTLLPIFQQLGIYDEFLPLGKRIVYTPFYKESLESYRPTDHTAIEEFTGYSQYLVPRPKLYALILKQVPAHKIHFGKRVLNITEEDDKVTIHTNDNGMHVGDIVVGADGAYSAVRQRMYDRLKAKGELPKGDQEDLPFSCTCLVGQTRVLDAEKYPIIKEPICVFPTVLGADKPFSWSVMSTAQGTFCWSVIHHLNEQTSKAAMEQRFRNNDNAEWGAYPAQMMCDETRNFPIPLGEGLSTLGDLYDLAQKDLISKVMLEEKVFTTWHSGRVVLMGDACHKLHPAGGHGAVTAMHDAITLANLIYSMPATTAEQVTKLFEEYQDERRPAALVSFTNSQLMSKFMEKGIIGFIVLYLITHMPMWLWRLALAQTVKIRPQVGFVPNIPLKGTVIPIISPSEQKARNLFERQQVEQEHMTVSI
ncbi:hypothetical protein EC957_010483 [Mortierella hygrophila]|uniref:FAD-binding domain-containing protein n=1 Tax=Mortierella hygrophila TaxID=979708 RepID=A0A9P6JXN7_9FUNG|nr:hypothetical protein EC957_010483 [Mortierella hygrophila]